MYSPLRSISLAVVFALASMASGFQVAKAVENANIQVSASGTVSIPAGQSTSGFSVVGNGTTGVVPVQIGPSASDDAANGILLGSVGELGRTVGSETLWSSSSVVRDPSGSLSLTTRKAGIDAPGTTLPNNGSLDSNLNAIYFPFSEGWVGGNVYSNGGTAFNEFVLNGMTAADIQQDSLDGGTTPESGLSVITIPGVTDTRRQGIFLANSGEDNKVFASVSQMSDGSAFTLQSTVSDENSQFNAPIRQAGDNSSFVFLPLGTPNMSLARVHTGNANEPAEVLISSGNAVTMVREAQGRFRLSIAGHTPTSGSLLINQHGSHDDLGGNPSGGPSTDNLPSFAPHSNGTDWVVLSEDISNSDPIDGKTGGIADSFPQGQDAARGTYFDLAFVPFTGGPTGPGAIPALSTLTGFSRSRVMGWNTEVTALPSDIGLNASDATLAVVPQSSTGINVSGIGSNRGDLNFYVDGAELAVGDGVMLATVTQGVRDNTGFLGDKSYGIADTTHDGGNLWSVSTSSFLSGEEHNINVAVAFFGADSGFETGTAVDSNNTIGRIGVTIADVDSQTDGVLMATAWGNDNNFATVTSKTDGSWDIHVKDYDKDAESNPTDASDGANYVYLPYDAENLVAGRVNADGTIVNSTAPAGFTLTRDDEGEYILVVAGKTNEQGMLLLNSVSEGNDDDNIMSYVKDGDNFRILGIDSFATPSVDGLEDTAFSFAFIDFVDDLQLAGAGLDGDLNADLKVDGADFLEFQRGFPGTYDASVLADIQSNYGTDNSAVASTSMVPEPSSALLCGLVMFIFSATSTRKTNRS
ncbi:hypothetical protein [Adhaeretor mobilis]|uniref:Uncharacterized protein n=1 Tax=Adhaeretor mobilis TaxID=1930276 RepID=A0A517N114_9BACT|nr:hypothetical protein [Adhaeretor mobilis]QDT00823.1 hypothetical protein HG15A2_41650 [Adhaeretor mobilis]